MKASKSKGSEKSMSMSILQMDALWLTDWGLGCVGSDPTLDEAENAGEKIVANKIC